MEKRYDFKTREKEIREFWEAENIYRFKKNPGRELYSIDTPPPTISGKLHIGHIFSYTQAEIIARYKRMRGYDVFYPFGFDNNGLPTERLTEKELGKKAKDMDRKEYIGECRRISSGYEHDYEELYRTLGFSVDWEHKYNTGSEDIVRISQELFLDLVEKDRAYIKDSPVLWCTECHTSVAQAELDTAEKESEFIYIPFYVGNEALTVATTRPELLFGCVAIFVNPEDSRYNKFIGKKAEVPLYGFYIPVIGDHRAETEKGSGAVMCATYGDKTDVDWCDEYGLQYKEAIGKSGIIDENIPIAGGKNIIEARKAVIDSLNENRLLIKREKINHNVSCHERCGTDIEIIPSRQWYIKIMDMKEELINAGNKIKWHPESMKNRYIAWVENLKWDWNISRQRFYGTPFPVWYCSECGKPVFADRSMLPADPANLQYKGSCTCGSVNFLPETGVMDTWATSSVTPFINKAGADITLPMSMRAHAHEIIRTWTFYSIVRSLCHTGEIPWKELMISGFVLAGKGEKISKSKNNASFEPSELIAGHSADAIRYWTAETKLGTDMYFSTDMLDQSRKFLTKLWNAYSFAVSRLEEGGFEKKKYITFLPADLWIIDRTAKAAADAAEALDKYEIGNARHVVDNLFWNDLCDNYIEIVKDRLYKPQLYGEKESGSALNALYISCLNILKMYSPYVPFITEYIYKHYFIKHEESGSIHLAGWPEIVKTNCRMLGFGDALKSEIYKIRKYKSENGLSLRAPVETVEIIAGVELMDYFNETIPDLKACLNAENIVIL